MGNPRTTRFFFVSDLHGRTDRYGKLIKSITDNPPDAVFVGGDLLPHIMTSVEVDGVVCRDFVGEYLIPEFTRLRRTLGDHYPRVFLILGNDDNRIEEDSLIGAAASGLWDYIHNRMIEFGPYRIFGYSYVPPTPYQLKDWEKYDVSRYVDPGCVSPEEGIRSVPVPEWEIRSSTIEGDLEKLADEEDLRRAIFLFHTPPYDTKLDRAALDGRMVDHVPVDVHVGSIAVRRFIESKQPSITLHGHIHESSDLTGFWQDRIGKTHMFSAAYHGPELALVSFDPEGPDEAVRLLL